MTDVSQIRKVVESVVDRALAGNVKMPVARTESSAFAGGPERARWIDWGKPVVQSPSPAIPRTPEKPGASKEKSIIAIGADHGGFRLKQQMIRFLTEELRYQVLDCGTDSEDSVDYPDIARKVATSVADGRAWRGLVIDAMGIGSGMAANRVPGVLCAVCHDAGSVRNAREHNDANVLAIGSRVVNSGQARGLIRAFLETKHAGGRHARRVAKIRALENMRTPVQRGA